MNLELKTKNQYMIHEYNIACIVEQRPLQMRSFVQIVEIL